MNIKIYIVMYKPNNEVLQIKNPIYIPIRCGKALNLFSTNSEKFLPELGDNTGDNISNKNPYYSELTGLYWIWKNDDSKPDDIVGLNHYRRYFSEPTKKSETENKLLGGRTIKKLLKKYDFIINGIPTDFIGAGDGSSDSAYTNYKDSHIIEDLDNALKCIKKLFPNLYDTIYHEVFYNGAMCLCNMFITKKKYLDEYCSFLFPVFRMLEYYIDFDDNEHQGYNQRVFGFLAERIFRPWLIATGHSGVQGRGLDWEKFSGYVWV